MSRYLIVPSTREHALMLRGKLREWDRFEVTCAGLSVAKAVWRAFSSSVFSDTAFVDGEIAAMFGCAGTPLSGIGTPWLLTTPAVERAPVAVVKEGRKCVERMLTLFPKLSGYTAAEYSQACGLLRLLGFTLSEPFPFGPDGVPFVKYSLKRSDSHV